MDDYSKLYKLTQTRHLILLLVLVGAINTGMLVTDINFIKMLSDCLSKYICFNIDKLIYVFIISCAFVLIVDRNTWLPFLGSTIIPEKVLVNKKNTNADIIIPIKTIPNAKIIYWSSLKQENSKIPDVEEAYGNYNNSGITESDKYGNAKLYIAESSSYFVPSGKLINRHVHYRTINKNSSVMSDVKTVYY